MSQIIEYLQGLPRELWAAALGVLVSSGLTQTVKQFVPDAWFPKHPAVAKLVVRVIAFGIGFAATFMTWPDPESPWRMWSAIAVGLTSPALYSVTTVFLYQKWPQLEKALSRDPEQ